MAESIGHRVNSIKHGVERRGHRLEGGKGMETKDKTTKFRFEDLRIWQSAISIADELFDISDELERKKLFRFADQLRGSGMSMSNNIAEGSGSDSNKEFRYFLNVARRSTFENANILILIYRRKYIDSEQKKRLMNDLDSLSRQIKNFQKSLK